jgi:hypothetical protein
MNALRHGITAEHVILDGESAKQFNALRRKLFEAFDPADAIEAELVQAIAMEQWRLRRHYRAEASLFTELGAGESLGGVFQATSQQLTTLFRYHSGIERSIHRNMAALERCQARRKGEAVRSPMSVIVTTPDEPSAKAPVVPAKAQPARYSDPCQLPMAPALAGEKDATADLDATQSTAIGEAEPSRRICETNPPIKLAAPTLTRAPAASKDVSGEPLKKSA